MRKGNGGSGPASGPMIVGRGASGRIFARVLYNSSFALGERRFGGGEYAIEQRN